MVCLQVKTVQICFEKLVITMGCISVLHFLATATIMATVFVRHHKTKIFKLQGLKNAIIKNARSVRLNFAIALILFAREFQFNKTLT